MIDSFAGVSRVAVLPVLCFVIILISVERTVCRGNAVLGAEIADTFYNISRGEVIHLYEVNGIAHSGITVFRIVNIVARDEREPPTALDVYTIFDAALCRLDCNVGDSLAANTGCCSVLHLCLPMTRNSNTIEDIGNCGGSGRSARWLGDGHNTADLFSDLGVVRRDEAANVSAVDLHRALADNTISGVSFGDGKGVAAYRCHKTNMICTCLAVTDAVVRPVIDDRVADFRLVGVILNPDAAFDSVIAETTAAALCTERYLL